MRKNSLLLVLSLGLLAWGMMPLPQQARAVDILAPQWAYDVRVGMELPELRTYGGVQYIRVKVVAISPLQIQFSHATGLTVENLTNIIDPYTYGFTNAPVPAKIPGQVQPSGATNIILSGNGPLASQMTPDIRRATGVDKLTDEEQRNILQWAQSGSSSGKMGLERLTQKERTNMTTWVGNVQAQRATARAESGVTTGPGPGPPIHTPLSSWIKGDFTGFQQGQLFSLGNGQRWRQVDNTTARYYPRRDGNVTRVHIRASGSTYVMEVEDAKRSVTVEPVH